MCVCKYACAYVGVGVHGGVKYIGNDIHICDVISGGSPVLTMAEEVTAIVAKTGDFKDNELSNLSELAGQVDNLSPHVECGKWMWAGPRCF